MKMKILVTTPTGKIGRRVLHELLAPEFAVRVITRDPARLPDEVLEQADVVCGSIDDPTALRLALDGVEAMFWCVPGERVRDVNAHGHYERFAWAACQAIRAAGTARVVTISTCGQGSTRDPGPIAGLRAMEEILNQSGAAIRHLRCGSFMENLQWQVQPIVEHGLLALPIPGHIPLPIVAMSDVADTALRWLVQRNWRGIERIAVHGPEPLSCNQIAAILERILERPVRYEQVAADHFLQSLLGAGVSAQHAWTLKRMLIDLAEGVFRAEPGNAEPKRLTTFASWVTRELVPLLGSILPQSKRDFGTPCVCHS